MGIHNIDETLNLRRALKEIYLRRHQTIARVHKEPKGANLGRRGHEEPKGANLDRKGVEEPKGTDLDRRGHEEPNVPTLIEEGIHLGCDRALSSQLRRA